MYPNQKWLKAIQQGWAGLAWPGQSSTPGRSQKLGIWGIKDIRPTKRLVSLWAPKISPNVINLRCKKLLIR